MISARSRSLAWLVIGAVALSLAGCNTVSRINPFQGGDRRDPSAPADERRISILAYEQALSADPEVTSRPANLPAPAANTAWPQAGGYPTHAMHNLSASGALNRAWERSIGRGSGRDSRVTARPVVAEGRIFALDASGQITAMDAGSGSVAWTQRLRSENRRDRVAFGGGLAYDGGRIYVHSGYTFLVALDAQSGAEVWRASALTPFYSAPTVIEGRVFVTTSDSEILAFDARTGDSLWAYQTISEPARIMSSPSPAVQGEIVLAPFASGEVVALRVQNGNPLWSDALTRAGALTAISAINDIAGSPVVYDGHVYAVSHAGLLAALDLRTGERVWTQSAGATQTPWVAGDWLYLVTSEGEVLCLDRRTGAIRWITQLETFANPRRRRDRIAWAGPVMIDGRLLLAGSNGQAVILDAASGVEQRRIRLRGGVFIAPVVAGQTVYLLSDDARLTALR
ncbi:MAG: PQQ-binding-like beta-propeller repeat protein [Maricaulaceae bacterium]|nr:PQQ-binding-like beta-propeller repeat protein [Maricaulaceae bacterium]